MRLEDLQVRMKLRIEHTICSQTGITSNNYELNTQGCSQTGITSSTYELNTHGCSKTGYTLERSFEWIGRAPRRRRTPGMMRSSRTLRERQGTSWRRWRFGVGMLFETRMSAAE